VTFNFSVSSLNKRSLVSSVSILACVWLLSPAFASASSAITATSCSITRQVGLTIVTSGIVLDGIAIIGGVQKPIKSIVYCMSGSSGESSYQFDYNADWKSLISTRLNYKNGTVVLYDTQGKLRSIAYTGLSPALEAQSASGNTNAYQYDFVNGVLVGTRSYQAFTITLFQSVGGSYTNLKYSGIQTVTGATSNEPKLGLFPLAPTTVSVTSYPW